MKILEQIKMVKEVVNNIENNLLNKSSSETTIELICKNSQAENKAKDTTHDIKEISSIGSEQIREDIKGIYSF